MTTKMSFLRETAIPQLPECVLQEVGGAQTSQPVLVPIPAVQSSLPTPRVVIMSRKAEGKRACARHRRRLALKRQTAARNVGTHAASESSQPPATPPQRSELARAHSRLSSRQGELQPPCCGRDVELREELIVPDLHASDKLDALKAVSVHLCKCALEVGVTPDDILAALLKRERLGSTGVGEGVAIPHARIRGLRVPVACFARAPEGVPFDSIDSQPVHFIFALLVPETAAAAHVRALACISRILMDSAFRERLCSHATRGDIYQDFVDAGLGDGWNTIEA